MFIGHIGVALAAKRFAPRTSLAILVLAAEFIDVLWPAFLLLGIEHVRVARGLTPVTPLDFYDYPWSHSLLAVGVWAVLFSAVYWFARQYSPGAIAVGLLVLSHWFLDLIVHIPDLPLAPGATTVYGVGLWNSRGMTVLVEGTIFVVGLLIYERTTYPHDRIGSYGFWSLIALLTVIYIVNVQGAPPPNVTALAWTAEIGGWLFAGWAWWADAHRIPLKA